MTKDGKRRRPSAGKPTHAGRDVRVTVEPAYWRTLTPIWHFKQMVLSAGPFGWNHLDQAGMLAVLAKLDSYVSRTWHDILTNTGSHEDTIAAIPSDLPRYIPSDLGDIDTLVSLRLTGPNRVWGWRTERTLVILFWDPDHKGWPSRWN